MTGRIDAVIDVASEIDYLLAPDGSECGGPAIGDVGFRAFTEAFAPAVPGGHAIDPMPNPVFPSMVFLFEVLPMAFPPTP